MRGFVPPRIQPSQYAATTAVRVLQFSTDALSAYSASGESGVSTVVGSEGYGIHFPRIGNQPGCFIDIWLGGAKPGSTLAVRLPRGGYYRGEFPPGDVSVGVQGATSAKVHVLGSRDMAIDDGFEDYPRGPPPSGYIAIDSDLNTGNRISDANVTNVTLWTEPPNDPLSGWLLDGINRITFALLQSPLASAAFVQTLTFTPWWFYPGVTGILYNTNSPLTPGAGWVPDSTNSFTLDGLTACSASLDLNVRPGGAVQPAGNEPNLTFPVLKSPLLRGTRFTLSIPGSTDMPDQLPWLEAIAEYVP
jgi:hypothetical protein